jgi:hypothetical protein
LAASDNSSSCEAASGSALDVHLLGDVTAIYDEFGPGGEGELCKLLEISVDERPLNVTRASLRL